MTKRHPAIPYVAPFAAFMVLLGLKSVFPLDAKWEYPVRVLIVSTVVWLFSRHTFSLRPVRPWGSIAIGVLVFAVWIGPDVLWPSYRTYWPFQNSLMGAPGLLPEVLRTDYTFLAFRLFGTAVLVPIIEELFWRGWLMRYVIDPNFERLPLGSYSAFSFWATAILFASEHGMFWDVGLAAGLIYNWWMLRTRNLADCMIAHAVTNAALAAYVILFGKWQYWL